MMSNRKSHKEEDKVIKSLHDWMQHYEIDEVDIDRLSRMKSTKMVSGVELANKAMDSIVNKRKENKEN